MKYLVDENISMPDKFINQHPEFENVKRAIKIGAIDDDIINEAKLKGHVIITKDIRLSLKALIQGVKVWFYDDKGNSYRRVAIEF